MLSHSSSTVTIKSKLSTCYVFFNLKMVEIVTDYYLYYSFIILAIL